MNRQASELSGIKPHTKKIIRVFLAFAVFYALLRLTPYPELKAFLNRPCSTRIFDRNGNLVQVVPVENGVRREYFKIDEIPKEIAGVFIQAEDSRFYSHFGVDVIAIARAGFQNITTHRRVSGASTITMQLARIIAAQSANQPRNAFVRKLLEAVNAVRLEIRFSKNQILEYYLNSLPFGFRTEGAASAAKNFFSSDMDMLTPAQIFCLAVIPRRPAAYNPINNPEECLNAAKELEKNFSGKTQNKKHYPLLTGITGDDWQSAVSKRRVYNYPIQMPHLVRYVMNKQKEITHSKNAITSIKLTADLNLQHYVEGLISSSVKRYYNKRISNGAVLVIDNKSGDVLAWAGSADFFNERDRGQIDGVLARNQPGSSMKPFLYALALEKGFSPVTVLADVPVNFGTEEIYIPQNFNNMFNGPVLFRHALASSLNIPAVYLLWRLGIKNYTDYLMRLQFNSLQGERGAEAAGLGLALGNAPVSLYELVHAFSIFPNDGNLIPLNFVISGYGEDKRKARNPIEPDRVISSDTARIICSFLSDPAARVIAFRSSSTFNTGFPVIFKTGTANQYQSIAALGASPEYSVGVWMGNFNGETVIGKTGSSVPALIARDTLKYLHKGKDAHSGTQNFSEPESYTRAKVCALSGMRPAENCPSVLYEYIPADEKGIQYCTWHKNSVINYPAEYQGWFIASKREGTIDNSNTPLSVITPRDGFIFFANPQTLGDDTIPVEVIGGSEDQLNVFYDDKQFTYYRPFKFFLPLEKGVHSLTVTNNDEGETLSFTVE
ncbi:penicillin-binding protein 1C [Spirochaetia bacterium]|nr:penicillin-binding protein 1C [Spirochaetia bacterium]